MLYIIADILKIARGGASKTHIMYKANLSTVQLNSHLNFLLDNTLLIRTQENDRRVYRPTGKGLDFLQRYQRITDMLRIDEDNGFRNGAKTPPIQLLTNAGATQKIRTCPR
jgi:predicted transcriptional regulator